MNPLIEALAAIVDNAIPWRLYLASFPRPPASAEDAPDDLALAWEEVRCAA